MKRLIEWYLIIKLCLFIFCLIIFIPFAIAFPEYFLNGIKNFLNNMLDDVLKHEIASKDEVDEYRRQL